MINFDDDKMNQVAILSTKIISQFKSSVTMESASQELPMEEKQKLKEKITLYKPIVKKELYKGITDPKVFYQSIFRCFKQMIAKDDTKFLPFREALKKKLGRKNYEDLYNLFYKSNAVYNYSKNDDERT